MVGLKPQMQSSRAPFGSAPFAVRASSIAEDPSTSILALTAPAGRVVGDLLIVFGSVTYAAQPNPACTGWTVGDDDNGGTDGGFAARRYWYAYRRADGTSADNYAIAGYTPGGTASAIRMVAFSGGQPNLITNPQVAGFGSASDGDITFSTAPGTDIGIAMGFNRSTSPTWTFTPAAGFTVIDTYASPSGHMEMKVATRPAVVTGATGLQNLIATASPNSFQLLRLGLRP